MESYASHDSQSEEELQITENVCITKESRANSSSPRPRKKQRNQPSIRSEVWNHFTKFTIIKDNVTMQKARCTHCGREFATNSKSNGTSSLKNHLKTCVILKNVKGDDNQSELLYDTIDGKGNSQITFGKYSQQALRKGIAEMIIVDELPFKFVEGKGFKKCISIAAPRFKMPSRWTVARDCYGIYLEEQIKLKKLFQGARVSLTTDCWTSLQNVNYICLTAHFIDENWKLNKRIINFCPIHSHKGENIGKAIEKCLRDWGIDKVFTITVDNASSNDTAVAWLKKRFKSMGSSILDGKYLHMRCIAHIVNLIVSDDMKEVDSSILKIRGAVKYVRQSPARMHKFKECVEYTKIESKSLLSLDVCTRWNSTYLMFQSAQKFEKAFDRFGDVESNYTIILSDVEGVPDHEDWEISKKLSVFLERFYNLTVKVSGSLYVTSNVFLEEICDVYCTLKTWTVSSDEQFQKMASKMLEKYDKYWGDVEKMNMLLYIGTVLDPRYKYDYVDFCFNKMYSSAVATTLSTKLRSTMVELFAEYKRVSYGTGSTSSAQTSLASQTSLSTNVDNSMVNETSTKNEYRKYKSTIGQGGQKSDLDKYINDEFDEDDDGFDILGWWKKNGHRFPIVANIARDVLAVSVSTVASESAFSTGGRVLNSYRSSLTPKAAQALICCQDWLRQGEYCSIHEYESDVSELDKLDEDLSKLNLDPVIDT